MPTGRYHNRKVPAHSYQVLQPFIINKPTQLSACWFAGRSRDSSRPASAKATAPPPPAFDLAEAREAHAAAAEQVAALQNQMAQMDAQIEANEAETQQLLVGASLAHVLVTCCFGCSLSCTVCRPIMCMTPLHEIARGWASTMCCSFV